MARVQMVVTDVASMRSGVCIAGYTVDDEQSIRPVLASGGGIPWSLLRPSRDTVVEPFSVIELDLRQVTPESPHTEDFVIEGTGNIRIIRTFPERDVRDLLERQSRATVSDLFDAEIVNHRFVRPRTGSCSLGTVKIRHVSYIRVGLNRDGKQQYRITFDDDARMHYRLPVTDVAFRRFADQIVDRLGDSQQAAIWLESRINRPGAIALRIGLSRAYDPAGGDNKNCYLLVTGIYTFPNYLEQNWSAYYPKE